MEPGITSYGIEALIARLHDEGVAAGQAEAAQLLEAACHDAERIRAAAHMEAQALRQRTEESLRIEREAALAAIQCAWRDALLALKQDLMQRFGERLRRQLREVLADDSRWQRVLAPLWPGTAPAAADLPGATGLAPTIEADLDADHKAIAAATWSALLAEGLELVRMPQGSGFLLRRGDEGPELQFDDESIAAWLLERLAPHVRQLIDGGPRGVTPPVET